MIDMADPYKTLGISRETDPKEIKKAYRQLAQKYHPDKNPDDETAAEKFKEICEAYEKLKSPTRQKKHHNGPYTQYHTDPEFIQIIRKIASLKDSFNVYAYKIENSLPDYAKAVQEYKKRNPGLKNIFKRHSMTPERKKAVGVIYNMHRQGPGIAINTKIKILNLDSTINILMRDNGRMDYKAVKDGIDELQQDLDSRNKKYDDAINVLSGRADKFTP